MIQYGNSVVIDGGVTVNPSGICRFCMSLLLLFALLFPRAGEADDVPALSELPLKRGYYVASDTPCGEASNATLMLLRQDGIGGARDFCGFQLIEQIDTSVYRVVEECVDFQGSDPMVAVSVYQINSDTRFTATSEQGWERSARYCEQSSLPLWWRDEDISDLIR